MAGMLSSLYKLRKAMQKAQQKAQQQQAAQATQSNTTANTAPKATTADSLVGTFTSKKAVPGTRNVTSNSVPMDDQQSGGLLGNLRSALFSGGVSAGGGVFSFGNRRQNKKGGLFNLFG